MSDRWVNYVASFFGVDRGADKLFMRILAIYLLPIVIVYVAWFSYMITAGAWSIFRDNWFMTLTMIAGSFVAGASSEGGGAIAFPAMTLVFHIPPAVARTFSLAIQSLGMTAAALWIIAQRIRIEKTYLVLGAIGGTAGVIAGSYYVAPFIAPAYAKMLFVSFWLSFGVALFAINHIRKRDTRLTLPILTTGQKTELILIGFIGGVLSSILGSGIDICTFAFVTMKYHVSEKVATPTSVILMASNAVVGYLLHLVFLGDVTSEVFNYWMVSIPVVILGAPLGAFVVNKLRRLHIASFLYTIIAIQFVTAIWIIQPGGTLLAFSAASFVAGLSIFFLLTRKRNQVGIQKNNSNDKMNRVA